MELTQDHPLVRDIKSGECILFLGAGVHAIPPVDSIYKYNSDESPPRGGELAEILAKKCNYKNDLPNEKSYSLQRVSLCYEMNDQLGRKELIDELKRQLDQGKKPSPILRMLGALPFKIFVTTNYDRLLEHALIKCGKDPEIFIYNKDEKVVTPDAEKDPTDQRPLVFKMHGDLEKSESIVITDEDYITFVQRMSDKEPVHPVPQTVRFRMVKWPILFIGYSLLDYNLRLLFRTLRWQIDSSKFPKAFSVDKYPDLLILKVYQQQKEYVAFLTEDLWNFVPNLFELVTGRRFSE